MLSTSQAWALVAAHVATLSVEQVGLVEAHGRFVADDLHAPIDLPPFDSSAMDGYALRAADTPGRLPVVGESAAGKTFRGALEPGEAIVISTGAVLPEAVDAVVPRERVTREGGAVDVPSPVHAGAFVRGRGSDCRRGARVLAAGMRLGPAQIGAAAACGLDELSCRRRPRVAVLTTGSELRPPGHRLEFGEIYDANGPLLAAALRGTGADVTMISRVVDDADSQRAALGAALMHDLVISSGGVSMGRHDLVRGVAAELGVREVFWKVAVRPGKPIVFGVRGATLLFGLPGNPVSTLVCFELFVRPALLALQGAADTRPAFSAGRLGEPVERSPDRDDLVRVAIDATACPPVLWPLAGQESHQITITAQADALALIPIGAGALPAGADVAYLPLQHS